MKVDCSTSKKEESNAKIGNEDLYSIHVTSQVRRASPANYKTTEQEVELMGGEKTAKVFEETEYKELSLKAVYNLNK